MRRVMSNWMTDYHHALLLRLLGIALFLGAWTVCRLLVRRIWSFGSLLIQRLPQGAPICWHQKP